jgi:uncharacterized protein
VEAEILPRYVHFDAAHRLDHVQAVIQNSLNMATHYNVNTDMVYVIAAYHDTGLAEGRERHHIVSGDIIRADKQLKRWFDEIQIGIMADAAEDHRASSKHEPRTIYGKIVAEADRCIEPISIIRRTIQFGLSHYPELDKEGNYQRTVEHMQEKYAEGGYLKLWIPESPNRQRLDELREIFRDKEQFYKIFSRLYDEEKQQIFYQNETHN